MASAVKANVCTKVLIYGILSSYKIFRISPVSLTGKKAIWGKIEPMIAITDIWLLHITCVKTITVLP